MSGARKPGTIPKSIQEYLKRKKVECYFERVSFIFIYMLKKLRHPRAEFLYQWWPLHIDFAALK